MKFPFKKCLSKHREPSAAAPGDALQYASAQRRQDRAIVLAAVRRQGRALQAAAPQLRDDKENWVHGERMGSYPLVN